MIIAPKEKGLLHLYAIALFEFIFDARRDKIKGLTPVIASVAKQSSHNLPDCFVALLLNASMLTGKIPKFMILLLIRHPDFSRPAPRVTKAFYNCHL